MLPRSFLARHPRPPQIPPGLLLAQLSRSPIADVPHMLSLPGGSLAYMTIGEFYCNSYTRYLHYGIGLR